MEEIYREAYESRLRGPQGSFSKAGAQNSPPNAHQPRHQHDYQQHVQQVEGGIVQTIGDVLWWLTCLIIFSFAALWLANALWQWRGRAAWNWITALPQNPRVQAVRQHVGQLPEKGLEETRYVYYKLRYSWYLDQVASRWNRFRNFAYNYFIHFVMILIALGLIWRLIPRDSGVEFIPLEEAGAYGWQLPEWARLQAERQKKGLNNYGSSGHADIPHIADSDVPWDEPEPVKKKSPRPDPVGSDPRWDDFAPSQEKKAAETTTITVYERDESPPSIFTRWATVFQPAEKRVRERVGDPIVITRWSTILPKEKTVYLTHTESNVETIREPTTITLYPEEEDQEISTVTSFEEKTVTIASTEFIPKVVTKWQPTIIANVTSTTIFSIRHTTLTNLQTVTIPGTTLTSTIYEEPETITVTDTTVIGPVMETETGIPSHVHRDHDHAAQNHDPVRRDVEGAVWCQTCRQFHCCQLPY